MSCSCNLKKHIYFYINSISQSHSSRSHTYQSCHFQKENKEKEICALQVIFATWNWIDADYHSLNSYKALIATCQHLAQSNNSYFPPTLRPPPLPPIQLKKSTWFLYIIFFNTWLKSLWISTLSLKFPQYDVQVSKHFCSLHVNLTWT